MALSRETEEVGRSPLRGSGHSDKPEPVPVSAVPASVLNAVAPMRRRTAQCAFVFSYLFDCMTGYTNGEWGGGCDGCTTYEDGEAFCEAFSQAFPGRKPDLDLSRASRRLRRLLGLLHEDGWLYRHRISNHDQYHPGQEPNWQYNYRLLDSDATKIKAGKLTAEDMARRYTGDAALLRDANSWYSEGQLEEISRAEQVPA
jgi:hypothetical protein